MTLKNIQDAGWAILILMSIAYLGTGRIGCASSPAYNPSPEQATPSSSPSPDPMIQAAAQEALDKAKVIVSSEGKEWYIDGDYDYVKGSVANKSDRTISYWSAIAYYSDKKGNILDSQITNSGDTLLPGARKHFEIMHTHLPKANYVRVEVQDVTFKD